jgi:predicted transcriptional regulator
MNTQKAFLGELEKAVMDLIWEQKQPVTVRFVYENLSKKRKIAYTTVMTIIGRLTEKGLLKKREEGKAYIYLAAYSKDKFLIKITRQIIQNFVSNFGETAVAHFTQEIEKIPEKKRNKLAKMLKDAK